MIEFQCKRRKADGTPIVSDVEVEEYAEAVLADYKPQLLKQPGKIKADHFLENYLGATLDYKDIYYEKGESPIAGATVFNDGRIKVFDRENMCSCFINVTAGTILIDNSTEQKGKEGFSLFTHLHEGGHFLMHPEVYRRTSGQLTLFPVNGDNLKTHTVICRRNAINDNKSKLVTEEDFREHQANTFAAAIAMPRQTFIPTATELLRKAGAKDGIWIDDGEPGWEYYDALETIIVKLAEIYGVSKSAAKVQLQRQHLLVSKDEYNQQRKQLMFAC